MSNDPLQHHFRLKKPCKNCPFRREGGIELRPGRLEQIVKNLLENDHDSFVCHKTVDYSNEERWDENGRYEMTQRESMCAGAAALLMKRGRPTVGMRLAFLTGSASPDDWDQIQAEIID